MCLLPLGWHGNCWHIANLLDQKFSLIDELLIIGAILQKVGEEGEEFFAVHEEDFLDGNRLVGIRNKDLEDVEAFILDHFSVVAE